MLVTSDAHPGLVDAVAATLPGASWQRCRTHFVRNLLTRVPKSAQPAVATMVRSIFAQPDAASVREQHARIVAQLEERFPAAAELLDEAGPDCWPSRRCPRRSGARSGPTTPWSASTARSAAARTWSASSPTATPSLRLVGAVLAEQNDEWADADRRYISLETIAKTMAVNSTEPMAEVPMIAA